MEDIKPIGDYKFTAINVLTPKDAVVDATMKNCTEICFMIHPKIYSTLNERKFVE